MAQFTCSTNADYRDAVHALQLQFMPAASRERPCNGEVGVCQTGAQTPLQTRVSKAGIRQRRLRTTLGRVS